MSDFEASIRALVSEAVRHELAKLGTTPSNDVFLSTTKAAEYASVAPATIRRWIAAGKLEEHHAGRVLRVSRAELDRMMKTGNGRVDSLTPEQRWKKKHG